MSYNAADFLATLFGGNAGPAVLGDVAIEIETVERERGAATQDLRPPAANPPTGANAAPVVDTSHLQRRADGPQADNVTDWTERGTPDGCDTEPAQVCFPQQRRADTTVRAPTLIEWPAPLADDILLLTPEDLPPEPFRLNDWTTVMDRAKYVQNLQAEIRRGEGGPRARCGALQEDFWQLRTLLGLDDETEREECPRMSADGRT